MNDEASPFHPKKGSVQFNSHQLMRPIRGGQSFHHTSLSHKAWMTIIHPTQMNIVFRHSLSRLEEVVRVMAYDWWMDPCYGMGFYDNHVPDMFYTKEQTSSRSFIIFLQSGPLPSKGRASGIVQNPVPPNCSLWMKFIWMSFIQMAVSIQVLFHTWRWLTGNKDHCIHPRFRGWMINYDEWMWAFYWWITSLLESRRWGPWKYLLGENMGLKISRVGGAWGKRGFIAVDVGRLELGA